MTRKIEWNQEYKNPQDQQDAFVDEFLKWSAQKRWDYLMKIMEQGLPRKPKVDGKRRIEWK